MNAVWKISTPKFLYMCVCIQTVFKKTTLYIFMIHIWKKKKKKKKKKEKKKGFYTNLCRFEIFSMKIVYAMEPEL